MFTGLVEALGRVVRVVEEGPGRRLTLAWPGLVLGRDGAEPLVLGESIAVNGCCLTVVAGGNQDDLVHLIDDVIHHDKTGSGKALMMQVQSALAAAVKLQYPDAREILVHVDPESRQLVAKRDEMRIDASELGRIAAKTAKQVIIQKICAAYGLDRESTTFEVQAGPETLLRTNLGDLQAGDPVNLERALRVGDRLGGHFVQGHVDTTAVLRARRPEGEWEFLAFTIDPAWTSLMVPKGSIAVDGVSLTLVDVTPDSFSVMLIPHTLAVTTLGSLAIGERVNIETDMLAKHVAKLLNVNVPTGTGTA